MSTAVRRTADVRAKLTQIETDLKAAIAREDFEQAATLRDELKNAKKAAQEA